MDNDIIEEIFKSMVNGVYRLPPSNTPYKLQVTWLKDNGFLRNRTPSDLINFIVTEKGQKVLRKGGWNAYNESIINDENNSKRRETIDYRLKKWQYWTFWIIFGAAIITLIVNTFKIIDSLRENNQESKSITVSAKSK